MDALSDQLEAFLQSQIQLPAAYKSDLMTQRTQLLTSIAEVEHNVLLLMEAFVQTFNTRVMFPNPKTVRLFEQRLFNEQCLVLSSDQFKSAKVNGMALEEESDILYITEERNPSKIRSLELKTRKLVEVPCEYCS